MSQSDSTSVFEQFAQRKAQNENQPFWKTRFNNNNKKRIHSITLTDITKVLTITFQIIHFIRPEIAKNVIFM